MMSPDVVNIEQLSGHFRIGIEGLPGFCIAEIYGGM
jgi:hypothetical protein